jgi:16S rRNA (adenine1518-N6/adenine1519-N6)-dimethyltransferase
VHIPRKRFGQHFLSDQVIIHRIAAAIAPRPQDHLVEIGPGQGALTLPVLKLAKRMDAVELDRDLIEPLQDRCRHAGELIVHESDVLEFDFASLYRDGQKLRVIGNLPYNISTPLIFHLLEYGSIISDMIFMLQKEVALRLAAKVSTNDYGRLSVMVQYYCRVEYLFDVPPTAFYPPPKVDSSIIQLVPYQQLPHQATDPALFATVVKQAFSQRRKTLRNSLKSMMTDDIWAMLPISSTARAENLSVGEFVQIANLLASRK